MGDSVKDKLQSSIRVGFASLAALVVAKLVQAGLPSDLFAPLVNELFADAAGLASGATLYFCDRLMDRIPAWWTRLLILKNPSVPKP